MVKIRLMRTGAKKAPSYRVVIAEARGPRDGRFVEIIGHYDPVQPKDTPAVVVINADRARYWLQHGAQPTDRVAVLLRREGVLPPAAPRVAPEKKPATAPTETPATA